jgi:release factor glutamine methyltransferase
VTRRPTVAALLAASGLPALEARALLARELGVPRERLLAHPEATVDPARARSFSALTGRRLAGEPLAYLLGGKEFYGRWFAVSAAVLVPRPETELLVELALRHLAGIERPRVLELGTGSGCIAITLALERPDAQITATDRSHEALTIARANAATLGASALLFVHGNWFEPLPTRAQFDLIVSNPPYVAADDPHLAALSHEPALALTSGGNGLAGLRAIIEGGRTHLGAGGMLAVEHGYDQAAAVRALLVEHGWSGTQTYRDAAGHERATTALR